MSTVRFIRAYPEAFAPMRAESSALGTIPTSAHQYCEAVRAASSFGWYVFPPMDIRLKWNGSDVFYEVDRAWAPLSVASLPAFEGHWNAHCPPELTGLYPPFMSAVPVRGVVQIWSGWVVSTSRDWSLLVRPLVNVPKSHLFECYEGVVETDSYGPAPLFTNIQLITTDVAIEIPKTRPLFQVQPLRRETYNKDAHRFAVVESIAATCSEAMSSADWDGYRKTIRTDAPTDDHRLGQYGVSVRKRSSHNEP